MTPERWNRIKNLFNQALALSEEQRDQFLNDATQGDVEMCSEIQSLIRSSAASHNDEMPASDFFSLATESTLLIGSQIGAYEVLREVSRGGMGIVLEGVRRGEFTQRVAIKVIRGGIGSEAIVKRFRAERSVLSALNHPNIAKFIDGGNLSDGAPFLVMEFIDGVPIDAYCDSKHYSIHQRLRLFIEVCSAVHYAHQNLVVHRDLKPSNIFVTDHGVKLLDFGIAKLLRTESTEQTIDATQLGSLFLTPEYASPEQILGRNITTASDTYSLGVLLYRLLTGERPYRFKSSSLRDVEHSIVDEQPTRPSTCALTSDEVSAVNRGSSKQKLARVLRGDLDTIILKALQKEPERRYSSVEEFQNDIQRHLSGLPVRARRDSVSYRLGKFVRRNKLIVGAAILILLSLAGGILASLWQARQAQRERDHAQQESEKAKQTVSVLKDLFSSADRLRTTTKDITVADVLENASGRIERDFADQPEIAADVLSTIGSTYEGLGQYEKAKATMHKALQLQRMTHGTEHPDVAEALHALGMIHHMTEERAQAESLYMESLAMFKAFGEPSNAYATTLNDYGVFVQDKEQYSLADSLLCSAIAMYKSLASDNRKQLASSLHNLALNYDWLGQLPKADSLYRESLKIQRDVYGGQNAQMASTIGNMGFIAEARGNFVEAERLYRESLTIKRSLLGEDHNSVASNKIKLGLFLLDRSSLIDEAEELCQEGLHSLLKLNPELKRLVGRGYLGVGRAMQMKGKILQAERKLGKAVEQFSQAQPMNAKNLAESEMFLARNLLEQQRYEEAEALLLKASRTLQQAGAGTSEEMKLIESGIKELYTRWQRD